MDNQEIFQKAIDKWGEESQIEMIIEECSELILALQKYKRNKNDGFSKERILHDVCDEIADVSIMIKQANIIFNEELIEKRIEFKMQRLEGRLNN